MPRCLDDLFQHRGAGPQSAPRSVPTELQCLGWNGPRNKNDIMHTAIWDVVATEKHISTRPVACQKKLLIQGLEECFAASAPPPSSSCDCAPPVLTWTSGASGSCTMDTSVSHNVPHRLNGDCFGRGTKSFLQQNSVLPTVRPDAHTLRPGASS